MLIKHRYFKSGCPIEHIYSVYKETFILGFSWSYEKVSRVELTEEEADEFIKKVDEWWNENHFESPEEYSFRVDNFNRPSIGIVIDYKEI